MKNTKTTTHNTLSQDAQEPPMFTTLFSISTLLLVAAFGAKLVSLQFAETPLAHLVFLWSASTSITLFAAGVTLLALTSNKKLCQILTTDQERS